MPWIPQPSICALRCFPGPGFGDARPPSSCIPCWTCAATFPRLFALLRARCMTSICSTRSCRKPAFYVMDRGYVDFERLFVLTLSSAFFVVRTKSNLLLQRRYSHPVDKSTGVCSDQTVMLSSFESASVYPDALRKVSYCDAETNKRLKFLTNNFTLPAVTIAQIYKQRWQVELFFESSTWCTPSDAMGFQEPTALNRPLVGTLDCSVRPCTPRRLLCAESKVRPRRLASPATVPV